MLNIKLNCNNKKIRSLLKKVLVQNHKYSIETYEIIRKNIKCFKFSLIKLIEE